MTSAAADRIRALNDAFRSTGTSAGTWLVTEGVQAQGPAFVLEALRRVRAFDRFTDDNDPYREHDFGSFELSNETLFWKIDYYDPDLASGSNDPSDPAVTRRVLTLMLASEY
jgi:hypothetical protein